MGNPATDLLDTATGGASTPADAIENNAQAKGGAAKGSNPQMGFQYPIGTNIFDVYKQVLPQSFGQAQPIYNPDAILAEYQSNLPAILKGGQNTTPFSVNSSLTQK